MSEPTGSGATADDAGNRGLQLLVSSGPARFVADQTEALGGLGLGPTPHDLVAAGLAACTAQTLRLYAERKGWPLGQIFVDVTHGRHFGATPSSDFQVTLTLGGELSPEQLVRLQEIAERCPVHRLLVDGARVSMAPPKLV